jgi:hypothetical protein
VLRPQLCRRGSFQFLYRSRAAAATWREAFGELGQFDAIILYLGGFLVVFVSSLTVLKVSRLEAKYKKVIEMIIVVDLMMMMILMQIPTSNIAQVLSLEEGRREEALTSLASASKTWMESSVGVIVGCELSGTGLDLLLDVRRSVIVAVHRWLWSFFKILNSIQSVSKSIN